MIVWSAGESWIKKNNQYAFIILNQKIFLVLKNQSIPDSPKKIIIKMTKTSGKINHPHVYQSSNQSGKMLKAVSVCFGIQKWKS